MRLSVIATTAAATVFLIWLILILRYFGKHQVVLVRPSRASIDISTPVVQIFSANTAVEVKRFERSETATSTPMPAEKRAHRNQISTSPAPTRRRNRSQRTEEPPLTTITYNPNDFDLEMVSEINGSLPQSFEWIKVKEFTKLLPYPITVTHYEHFFIVDPPNSSIIVVSLIVLENNQKSMYMQMLLGPSTQNKFQYALGCQQYSLAVIYESLDKSRVPNWSKIRGLLEIMRMPNSRYEWLFWIDADAVFMNFQTRIESLMIDSKVDLYFTEDFNGFNSGVFLIRNSAWSRALLAEAYVIEETKPKEFRNSSWFHDQDALGYMISHSIDRSKYVLLPKRNMNSYDGRLDNRNDFKRGDFIVHQPGCSRYKKNTVCGAELVERAAKAIPCLQSGRRSSPDGTERQ